MTITSLGDGDPVNGTGPPVVRDVDGRYVVEWPRGRASSVEVDAGLFESMVSDLNDGRMAMRALSAISQALTAVVPSA